MDGNTVGTALGVGVLLIVSIVGLAWFVLPLIIIAKFNKLIKEQKETNGHLSVVAHQISVLNGQAPR